MAEKGAHVKHGKVFVVRFYSKRWGQNAFFKGMEKGEPKYTKSLKRAKAYKKPHNANKIAEKLTEQTSVVHRNGIWYC